MSKAKNKPTKEQPPAFRDRIKELRRVPASELVRNPKNWRVHPPAQRAALTALLREVGYAGALLARELPDSRLMLIDGELRSDITPEQVVPVLVLDVNEAEADKLLATLDPISAQAEVDQLALTTLQATIETDDEALSDLLAKVLSDVAPAEETELRQLAIKPPPKMTWVLVGIETVKFGAIAELVEKIAGNESTIVETTANDG